MLGWFPSDMLFFAVLCPRPNRHGLVQGVNLESRGFWQTGVHLIKVMVRARGVDSDTPPLKESVVLCVCEMARIPNT